MKVLIFNNYGKQGALLISNSGNETLREILRRYPTGVTVVTSIQKDGSFCGGTMNSFTSVSLDPPLLALFIIKGSRTARAIEESGKFIVNILKGTQECTAKDFATDGNADKFAGHSYSLSKSGIPVLNDSLGHIECTLYKREEIADHIMVVGRVANCNVISDEPAMVFYKRKFMSAIQ